MGVLTDKLNALLSYANDATGQSDTTLGDAIASLVDGFGQGGEGGGGPTQASFSIIQDKYYSQGNLTKYNGWNATDMIRVPSGARILRFNRLSSSTQIAVGYFVCRDANGNLLSIVQSPTPTVLTDEYCYFVMPSGTASVGLSADSNTINDNLDVWIMDVPSTGGGGSADSFDGNYIHVMTWIPNGDETSHTFPIALKRRAISFVVQADEPIPKPSSGSYVGAFYFTNGNAAQTIDANGWIATNPSTTIKKSNGAWDWNPSKGRIECTEESITITLVDSSEKFVNGIRYIVTAIDASFRVDA